MIWSLKACLNHCEGLHSTFPKIGTTFDAHSLFLSLIHPENRHRPRTRLQINMFENCTCPPTTCNLAHWLTRHGSPTIYQCFALPQLLYRWQHQSGKFWIPSHISELVEFSAGQKVPDCIWKHSIGDRAADEISREIPFDECWSHHGGALGMDNCWSWFRGMCCTQPLSVLIKIMVEYSPYVI
jgi:hypothetical protein